MTGFRCASNSYHRVQADRMLDVPLFRRANRRLLSKAKCHPHHATAGFNLLVNYNRAGQVEISSVWSA